tara:strand:- start:686 stop:850 length:165 start_codon:yes stop_codon:yes gene_type:complete
MKKPSVGDRIEHTNLYGNPVKGTVDMLLSAQFVYITDDGHRHYCLFREPWKLLK